MTVCRYGPECVYLDGPHREHAWTDRARARIGGVPGHVYVYSLQADDEFPDQILVGLQQDRRDGLGEAKLTIEQAVDLLSKLTKAVCFLLTPSSDADD